MSLEIGIPLTVETLACMHNSLSVVTLHEVQHVIHNKLSCGSQAAK